MSDVIDLLALGLQFQRSWDSYTSHRYPNGNVPVEVADFFATSSSLFKGVVTLSAYYAQGKSGAQMAAAISPLTNALAGITLASNFTADVFRFGQAIDGGNQDQINEAAIKLLFSILGALVYPASVA